MIASASTRLPNNGARYRSIFATLCLTVLLSACALTPGMYMGRSSEVANKFQGDPAPTGALTTITPELIEKQEKAQAKEVRHEVKRLYGTEKAYTVGPGDILNIVVWGHPELALAPATSNRTTGSSSQVDVGNGYSVNAKGSIQFPFLGVVKVSGMTENQIREMLTTRIAKYIQDPQLTVRMQAYRHSRVYIDGEVREPGLQVMDDIAMTLPEAVNRAGGFTEAADRSSIRLTRNGKTTDINLPELIRQGVNPGKIMLKNGDMLRIVNREESKVFVLGEVVEPRSQELRDGHLTLTEALGESRGANPLTSEPQQIYVIRKGADGKPDIYHLDGSSPTAFVLADGFPLKAHDVVFVDPAPVVRWKRVISMLIPSYDSLVPERAK